jgi:cytochrome c-type biogenesis protein CcmH
MSGAMKTFVGIVATALFALGPLAAHAADAVPTDKDAVAASRAVKLSEQLRCLVCQNQTIADSSAELAQDLRQQVREQIAAGKTDAEIIDFMTSRYGDFVLYRPPVKAQTMILWAGPGLLLIVGFGVLLSVLRKRRGQVETPPLSDEEHERAERLLTANPPKQ